MAELTGKKQNIARGYLAATIDLAGKKKNYTIRSTDKRVIDMAHRCAVKLGLAPLRERPYHTFQLTFREEDQKKLEVLLFPYFAKDGDMKHDHLERALDPLRRIRWVLEEQEEQRELTVLERSILEASKEGKKLDEELGKDI